MANFNKVVLVGNLTRDPELRFTAKGSAVGDLAIAINRSFQSDGGEKREETTFVDIKVWSKTAENCGKFLKKGASVLVEGRLQTDQWEDKQSGQKRTKLVVVGDRVEFLSGKSGNEASGYAAAPRPANKSNEFDDDDIPF